MTPVGDNLPGVPPEGFYVPDVTIERRKPIGSVSDLFPTYGEGLKLDPCVPERFVQPGHIGTAGCVGSISA